MKIDFSPKDMVPFLEDVTDRAGQAVMSYFHGSFKIDLKDTRPGGIDIVTDADRASEEIILGSIRREFPDHDILTEETHTDKTGSPWLWLVDPLDGTVNFAHGIPVFSVSIASHAQWDSCGRHGPRSHKERKVLGDQEPRRDLE